MSEQEVSTAADRSDSDPLAELWEQQASFRSRFAARDGEIVFLPEGFTGEIPWALPRNQQSKR